MANFEIVVTQRRLTHYRVPFFQSLRDELSKRGIRLRLVIGEPTEAERTKNDCGHLPWAIRVPTRYWLGGRLCWLSQAEALRGADLIVLTPENKILSNLPVQYFASRPRIALWGHGANLQGNPNSLRERLKRVVARKADWWLAYTDISLPLIERAGFPIARSTVLQNAVDTSSLATECAAVTPEAVTALRKKLGLSNAKIGLFIGSLYGDKRIDFLLESAVEIKRRVPDFALVIVGGGPQRELVEAFCAQHDWAKYLGVCKGRDKVEAMALARVMLNPGLVGLGILDSFVGAVPMVTTDCGLHSPEIAYLDNGVNGLMTENERSAFVDVVCNVLESDDLHAQLIAGCREAASRYTVANMARNFADGVEQCLAMPHFRSLP